MKVQAVKRVTPTALFWEETPPRYNTRQGCRPPPVLNHPKEAARDGNGTVRTTFARSKLDWLNSTPADKGLRSLESVTA